MPCYAGCCTFRSMKNYVIAVCLGAILSGCSLIKSSGVVTDQDVILACAVVATYCSDPSVVADPDTAKICTAAKAVCSASFAPENEVE